VLGLYDPREHCVHEAAFPVEYDPGRHDVHAPDDVEPVDGLYVPAEHPVQYCAPAVVP